MLLAGLTLSPFKEGEMDKQQTPVAVNIHQAKVFNY